MRVVVAAIPFGFLESISERQVMEQALIQAAIGYEVTQTALLLDPGAQANAFLRRKPPYLYFLIEDKDLSQAREAIGSVNPHALEA